jgi:hypothetical protein
MSAWYITTIKHQKYYHFTLNCILHPFNNHLFVYLNHLPCLPYYGAELHQNRSPTPNNFSKLCSVTILTDCLLCYTIMGLIQFNTAWTKGYKCPKDLDQYHWSLFSCLTSTHTKHSLVERYQQLFLLCRTCLVTFILVVGMQKSIVFKASAISENFNRFVLCINHPWASKWGDMTGMASELSSDSLKIIHWK